MTTVTGYELSILKPQDCRVRSTAEEIIKLFKTWRKGRNYANRCETCKTKLAFPKDVAFQICCGKFYHRKSASDYPINSISIPTPGYEFVLTHLKRAIEISGIQTDQHFLVLPDPIFWQMNSTLVYEKVMKFIQGLPITSRTDCVIPSCRSEAFYEDMIYAPLNYSNMERRSSGKYTMIRKHAYGKRSIYAMRGMIVPDATLKPNEIRLSREIVSNFGLAGKWVILNRMPSLTPGSFVGLKVHPDGWPYDVIGLALEIIEAINGDFDGDETNIYLVPGIHSQVECATLLNSQQRMGCFVSGMKLSPSQDLQSAYYMFYDQVDFLPYKNRDLRITMQVIYDLYGSEKAFECYVLLANFYLEQFQKETCFALTLGEMERMHEIAKNCVSVKQFETEMPKEGCLAIQVLSGAKGSSDHLYQLFGKIGKQRDVEIKSSFWGGMNPREFVAHAMMANEALQRTTNIWQPGYGYNKCVFNLQGLHVDYLGRLMDGEKCVIERDVLRALKHTDLMSEEAFTQLLYQFMTKNVL